MPCQKRPPLGGCNGPEGKGFCCNVCRDIRQRNELQGKLAGRTNFPEKTYAREVAQLCGGTLAQWKTHYTLSAAPTGSVVTVRVAVHAEDSTGSATLAVKGLWASMISTVWSSKAQLVVPVYASPTATSPAERLTRNVMFELQWVDAGTPSAYKVKCTKTKTAQEYIAYFDSLSDAERQGYINSWKTSVPNLQAYSTTDPEWQKLKVLGDVPRDHNRHGTPHLGEWGDADHEAVQHEFGHALGLPDEYLTTNYWIMNAGDADFTEITLDLSVYNLQPFTSRSLMNNTMSNTGSKVFPRHFDLLCKDFEDFARTNLAAGRHVKAGTCTVQFIA